MGFLLLSPQETVTPYKETKAPQIILQETLFTRFLKLKKIRTMENKSDENQCRLKVPANRTKPPCRLNETPWPQCATFGLGIQEAERGEEHWTKKVTRMDIN